MSNVGLAGVDGCRGGWLAAVEHDGSIEWQWVESFRELYDDTSLSTIAVDVPIGLPETGSRVCDAQARQIISKRRSSVFAAPVRAILNHTTYAEARAALEKLGASSMSAQAFGIVRAVRDVDACVTEHDDDRIVETHPEVAFFALGGPIAKKRSAQGVAQRLLALGNWRRDVLDVLATAPAGAPVDDALDALACLWSAERWAAGERRTLGDGERDVRNLPMRIAPAP